MIDLALILLLVTLNQGTFDPPLYDGPIAFTIIDSQTPGLDCARLGDNALYVFAGGCATREWMLAPMQPGVGMALNLLVAGLGPDFVAGHEFAAHILKVNDDHPALWPY